LLRVYYEVANTGNYSLLQSAGEYDEEQCLIVWEEIVKRNCNENNSAAYSRYVKELVAYRNLRRDYLVVKGMLFKLLFDYDKEYVNYLNTKGYRISKENDDKYAKSVMNAQQRSENLVSKIATAAKVLQNYGREAAVKKTFETVMANLTYHLKFTVPDDITLARYNEYNKMLKAKENAERNVKRVK
jgi:hypothetical protein